MIVCCVDNHNSASQPDLASLHYSILLDSRTYSKCFSYPRAYFTWYYWTFGKIDSECNGLKTGK